MNKLLLVLLLIFPLSGCVVGTAVGVATDVVVGTASLATDIVGTTIDVVTPGKKKKKK